MGLQGFVIHIFCRIVSHDAGEQVVAKLQHRLHGAEIVIQPDQFAAGRHDLVAHSGKDADVGAAEPVDRLFCISYHEQTPVLQLIPVSAAQQIHQLALPFIGVLELIHQDVPELLSAFFQHLRVLLQQGQGLLFQIVKGKKARRLQFCSKEFTHLQQIGFPGGRQQSCPDAERIGNDPFQGVFDCTDVLLVFSVSLQPFGNTQEIFLIFRFGDVCQSVLYICDTVLQDLPVAR